MEEFEQTECERRCRTIARCRIPARAEKLLPARCEANARVVAVTECNVYLVVSGEIANNETLAPISRAGARFTVVAKLDL